MGSSTATASSNLAENDSPNNAISIKQGRDSGRIRKAFPSDLAKSTYSRSAKAVYTSLCNHRQKENIAWPAVQTIAAESGYCVRSVQRALAELIQGGAVCCPSGDHGGRRRKNSIDAEIRGNTTIYHLHPPGGFCRYTGTENAQRGRPQHRPLRVTESHPLQRGVPADLRVTSGTDKGDKSDTAYKEEPSGSGTFSNLSTSSSTHADSANEKGTDPTQSEEDLRESVKAWDEIQILVGARGRAVYVDQKARDSVQRTLRLQDCSLEDLLSFLRKQGLSATWRNRVAGLIQITSELGAARRFLANPGAARDGAESIPFTVEQLRSHLQRAGCALIQSQECPLKPIGQSLLSLSADTEKHINRLEDLEQQLTLMEEKVIAALRAGTSEEDLFAICERLNRELKPYRGKMTADQLAMLERRYTDRALLERANIPRLSLFYVQ